ncbi:MAG: hypothetical protein HUU06_09760 [Planctomycetaceae bacterium]|nr:hypothetical protein [Planctomycetota bacterium]NUN53053.1 hypothetical protein [Planctomycetaceae bacterium]
MSGREEKRSFRFINEFSGEGNDCVVWSIAQDAVITGYICKQDSPREEWWVMRQSGSDLFLHPSPSSGDVSMLFSFVESRNAGGSPAPFTGPGDFKAWVVARTGVSSNQWALAVHSIS